MMLALLSIVFVVPAFSETIVLKSKEIIQGKIRGSTDSYILVNTGGISKTYFLSTIKTIDGIQTEEWVKRDNVRFYNTLNLLCVTAVGLVYFYLFFVAEAFPLVGWYSFNISNTNITTRVIIFLFCIAGMIISFKNRTLGWLMVSSGIIYLISFSDESV